MYINIYKIQRRTLQKLLVNEDLWGQVPKFQFKRLYFVFIDYEIVQVLVQGESVVKEEKVLEGFLQVSNSLYIDIDVRIGAHWIGAGRRW